MLLSFSSHLINSVRNAVKPVSTNEGSTFSSLEPFCNEGREQALFMGVCRQGLGGGSSRSWGVTLTILLYLEIPSVPGQVLAACSL